MTRSANRVGDLYEVQLDESRRKIFQYVAKDRSMLNSAVIRVFRKTFHTAEDIDTNEVVRGEVDFYAHVLVLLGVKMGSWRKIGHSPHVDTVDVVFRISDDIGKQLRASCNWRAWKVNKTPVRVENGLEARLQNTEIGAIIAPQHIVDRIRTGKYHFAYPDYRDPIH
jgi:hypothetical protein